LNASQGLFAVQQEEFAHKAQYEKMKALLAGGGLDGIYPTQGFRAFFSFNEGV